jgi:hypothetical protein
MLTLAKRPWRLIGFRMAEVIGFAAVPDTAHAPLPLLAPPAAGLPAELTVAPDGLPGWPLPEPCEEQPSWAAARTTAAYARGAIDTRFILPP